MSRGRRCAYLALDRLVRPMTDWFLAVAPQLARGAVEMRLAPPGAVSVVPSAVELDVIPKGPDPRIRDQLGIPADVPLVGTLGHLEFQKAPLDFVRMAALVAASHPRARFLWVRDGKLLDEARREAFRLGVDVTFTGFHADAAVVAASFDVYVVCSLYEGLGRAPDRGSALGPPGRGHCRERGDRHRRAGLDGPPGPARTA
jgi:glycosyltransferase involved in cell wall biosynthesis